MKKKNRWLAPLCFLLLTALTIYIVIRQSKTFTAEGFWAYLRSVHKWGLIGAALCAAGFVLFEALALKVICRALGYRFSLCKGIVYASADIYFSAVTPGASGGQPASALLMMRDGIPGAVTTVALLLNLMMYAISLFVAILAGIPFYPQAYQLFSVPSHILILLGVFFQLLLLLAFMLLIFREKIFMRIADFLLALGQRLHIVKDAESRRSKFVDIERDYRACAHMTTSHIGSMVAAMGLNILHRLSNILVTVVIYAASGGSVKELGRVFAIQTWVVMGASSVPVPGSVGVADYLFLDGYSGLMEDPVNFELLSRTISFYACILVCALVLLLSIALHNRRKKAAE